MNANEIKIRGSILAFRRITVRRKRRSENKMYVKGGGKMEKGTGESTRAKKRGQRAIVELLSDRYHRNGKLFPAFVLLYAHSLLTKAHARWDSYLSFCFTYA